MSSLGRTAKVSGWRIPSLERRKILWLGHGKFGEAPTNAAGHISDRVGPIMGDFY
jgi:hypothetical protein